MTPRPRNNNELISMFAGILSSPHLGAQAQEVQISLQNQLDAKVDDYSPPSQRTSHASHAAGVHVRGRVPPEDPDSRRTSGISSGLRKGKEDEADAGSASGSGSGSRPRARSTPVFSRRQSFDDDSGFSWAGAE